MSEGGPGESANPKGVNPRVGSVMGKPFRLPTLVPTPQVLAILSAQPWDKTVGKTLFSEIDYFHRGGSFVFALGWWQ